MDVQQQLSILSPGAAGLAGARRLEAAAIHPGAEMAYPPESGENQIPFFWTKPQARLTLPGQSGDAAVALFLGSPHAGRTIAINGQSFTLRAGFAYYAVAIPPETAPGTAAASHGFEIACEGWHPPGDSRELGVKVSHAIILPAGPQLDRHLLILQSAVHYEVSLGTIRYGYPFDRRDVLIDEICRHVDFHARTVLDIGCSFGHFHPHLYARQPRTLIALDYSAAALRVVQAIADVLGFTALRTVHANVDYAAIVRPELAGEPGSSDVVLLCGVLYHVLSPLKLLLEACALVRDRGVLVVETHLFAAADAPLAKLGFLDEFDHPEKMKWMLSESLLRLVLKSQGFQIEHTANFTWPEMITTARPQAQRILLVARKNTGGDVLRGFTLDESGHIATKPAPHW